MKALLYKPAERWRIGVAFLAAIALHVSAIALATHDPESGVSLANEDFPDAIPIEPERDTPPTPEPEELIAPAPPAPTEEAIFNDERPTPPSTRSVPHPTKPLVRQDTSSSPRIARGAAGRAFALNSPRPNYPYEARRQHLTGSGVVAFTVDPMTGAVTDVVMSRSTGSAVLDDAAISGFRRWRFKPGTPPKVQTPITFTLTGAAF